MTCCFVTCHIYTISPLMSQQQPITHIFIDGSYYVFYRFTALLAWWRNSHPEDPILLTPSENAEFCAKFDKIFVERIVELPKKLKIHKQIGGKPKIYVGKDCHRENIWRMKLWPSYKSNRVKTGEDAFTGGPFFAKAYESLFTSPDTGISGILESPNLEADDCIALSVMKLISMDPTANVIIIASDRDYLQLASNRVQIYTLAYKNICESASSHGNCELDLMCKIVSGDVSDCIPQIKKGCSAKAAHKICTEPGKLEQMLANDINARDQFNINSKLIDFRNIPAELVEQFWQLNGQLFL